MTNPTYRIILRAQPQSVDPGARLQRLLKLALRSFGFRCVDVRKLEGETTLDKSKKLHG